MADMQDAHFYSASEERLNIASHALGLVLSIIGLALLLWRTTRSGDATQIISCTVFGLSLITLYAASTLYHSTTSAVARRRLRAFDHASIYVLIAGSYTPLALLVLRGTIGWAIFAAAWSLALVGIVIKLRYTGRYHRISTGMYVFMGWIIVFAYKPLIANFSTEGLSWLFAGGVAYTVGAIFYSIRSMPFAHASFHIFVLLGSACHFISVYHYVLLANVA
jgi:hemolysin III